MILGNHDRGKDSTGETLLKQIRVLQEKYCAWDLKIFNKLIFFIILILPSEISPINRTISGFIIDKIPISTSDH